jgi:hypothetical protein
MGITPPVGWWTTRILMTSHITDFLADKWESTGVRLFSIQPYVG